jgi:hypothetical protein
VKLKGRPPESGWYHVMRVHGPDPKILPASARHVQGYQAAVERADALNAQMSQEERARGDHWEVRYAPPGRQPSKRRPQGSAAPKRRSGASDRRWRR